MGVIQIAKIERTDNNNVHEIYITKKQLATRGWTDGMIKKTGLPVVQGKERKHGMMVKINYYPFSKVKEAEQTEGFAEMKAKAEKERMARIRNEEKQTRNDMETFVDAVNELKPPKRIPIEELRQLTLESNRDEWIRQSELYDKKRPTQEEIDAYTLADEPKWEKLYMKRYVKYHIMEPKPPMITKIPEGFRASYLDAVWKVIEQVYPELISND